jgi:uncharacterized paraquat-inducible protein A
MQKQEFLLYDDRVPRLSAEIAHILRIEDLRIEKTRIKGLADQLAKLASRRLVFEEPDDQMRCHTCDAIVPPKERVRVAVCLRCASEVISPDR